MKKIIYLPLVIIAFTSCTKNNDSVKEELEKALPTIALTSLGLVQQTGPFNASDVIQVTFGGSMTKATPGSVDFAWYTAPSSGSPALVDSVHFDSWDESAAGSNGNNSVATTYVETTYPNTLAFSSRLNLKLSKLPGGSKSYTLKVYGRTTDNQVGSVSVTKFVTIK